MNRKHFQTIAQWVGTVTIAALCIYGLLSLIGVNVSGVSADTAQSVTQQATDSRAVTDIGTFPSTFNYEGILRETDGSLTNGSVAIQATIYDSVAGGSPLYRETFSAVNVRDGQFNILLGDSANSANQTTSGTTYVPLNRAFSSPTVYLGITIDSGNEIAPRERIHPVPWAMNAFDAYNGVPIGGIVDWVRPSASFQVPDGFEICNGQTVTVEDPATGTSYSWTLPDLNNLFSRGTTNINATGTSPSFGSDTHTHTTVAAGSHSHAWLGAGDGFVGTWDASGTWQGMFSYSDGWDSEGGGITGAVWSISEGEDRSLHTAPSGSHSHDVNSSSNVPRYYSALKLCRTR